MESTLAFIGALIGSFLGTFFAVKWTIVGIANGIDELKK